MNNSKLFISAIGVISLTLAVPLTTEAQRGGGGRGGFSGGRGGFSGGRPGFSSGQFAGRGGMAMHGGNMHGGNMHGHNHFHGHPNHVHNRVVFIGGFGFPWWWGWGWGWGPWWGWDGYPYGYYGYGYPYGYGYGYGSAYGYGNGDGQYGYGQYGNASQSRVAELQRRLQSAGYYHGSIDGILGEQTRAAIRAYEQAHGDVS
jgi:hypothetical protein